MKQGAQIPIQTTVNNTISTQYVDAVLRLEVTPQITAEGTVFLDVTVENTQIDYSIRSTACPTLDTQSAQTKVLIERRRHRGHRWRDGDQAERPPSRRCRCSAASR